MALPPEKAEPLREYVLRTKFRRAKEKRIAELLEKLRQEDEEKAQRNPQVLEKKQQKSVMDRIIGSSQEALETTSAQQKIDPIITTKEVAVTTEIDRETNVESSTTLRTNARDGCVQTVMPIKRRRGACTNCCGGLPGCGPGFGQGCGGRCSCIPGVRIMETGFCDEEKCTNSMNEIQLPRLFVKRRRGNRLRGGGGIVARDSKKPKMLRICRRKEKKSSLPTRSSVRRPKEGSIVEEKEHGSSRGFHRSLSSLRGQLAWWEEAHESCWESCLNGGCSRSGKNCVGRRSVSTECVPTSYNSVSGVLPGISERPRNFRRKQNVMAAVGAAARWTTSRSSKLLRGTMASSLLALPVPTSKCVRKGFVDLVGDKCRKCLAWETTSLALDERGWSDSRFRKNSQHFPTLGSKTLKRTRNNRANGHSLNADTDKTIWNASDVQRCSSTEYRFDLPRKIMIPVWRSKSWQNYNFSRQRRWLHKDPSRRILKLERNDQERLRGGGSSFDLIAKRKLQQETNSKDQSTMDNLSVIESTPFYKDGENSVTNVACSENTNEDGCSWSHDLTNKRVLRFREEQGCCGNPEHRNEDGRARGGCGGPYKHSYFSNASATSGRRDLQYPRSPCCSQARPQVSCRAVPPGRPPCCPRSLPTCPPPPRFQNHVSCGRIDRCSDTRGRCPCNSCGGPACNDNSDDVEINRCCRTQQMEQYPCHCKCQTCKGFQSCGGCGGQSCGRIYSCAGSSGGTCCFPRNTARRTGPECCGGGNPNCGGCC
ncbi:hypothetical protein KPH14_006433 [Odynerus spinipes]|uniref:Post-SET domain-containing protein n=1 Tax=Odynerus spinipes TaxID=1348599 RepID=A0AAD9VS00_9HYME|nr:hypothetical protein KPH14_006433 [Odynerus spinipes]